MPDVHAKLSASGAHRWIACPGSYSLEKDIPDKSSEAAQEGTVAHSLAEAMIKYNNGMISKTAFNRKYKEIKESQYYCEEMDDCIRSYADQVWEIFNEIKKGTPDAILESEQRLDFSEYVPGGFGTGDVVIIADGVLQIIDLKYGKGVRVDAEGNPQLRLYGIGAVSEWDMLYDIRSVRMTIIQPRLDHISTEELPIDELRKWAEEKVKPAAEEALSCKGSFHPGEVQCRFCKAQATCRARAEENLKLAQYEFKDPPQLTDDEIADVLSRVDELVRWASDVKDYALKTAVDDGVAYPGWKLVEGRSNRIYTNEDKIREALINEGYAEEEIYKKKILGVTAMQKLLGKKKFDELIGDYIEKPEGKPVLVPESDRRPAINKNSEAVNDFKED